jgi:exodeoxyribonuclease VII large subunit
VTIADFVADLRAPTPSAAAEMIVCTRQEVLDRIAGARGKLAQAARYRLAMLSRRVDQQGIGRALSLLHRNVGRRLQRIDELEYGMRERLRAALEGRARGRRQLEGRLARFDPRPRFAGGRRRLEAARSAAIHAVRLAVARRRGRAEQVAAQLSQLSPLKILERGYAIVTTPEGSIVKRSAAAPPGSEIRVRLAEGRLAARVEKGPEE